MISWRKLMGLSPWALPNLIVAFIPCCEPRPFCSSIGPSGGNQGTTVSVVITGGHFDVCNSGPAVVVDGNTGLVAAIFDPNHDVWNDTEIYCLMEIGPNAPLGVHNVVVETASGISAPVQFVVTSPGSSPPPGLLKIDNYNNLPLIPGGLPVGFKFVGTNLMNTNLQVNIDPSISFPPGPYVVQRDLYGDDYFLLDITADATATASIHYVYLTTDGGDSNVMTITVDASQPLPSPSPGSPPFLSRITPTRITKSYSNSPNHQVSIKLEGTGFGTRSGISVDPNTSIQSIGEVPGATNPDTVVTGTINFYLPPGTDSLVALQLNSFDNGSASNFFYLVLDEPVPGAPNVDTAYTVGGPLHQNGDADIYIDGENLQGLNEQSFSGVPSLTFSNVVYYADNVLQVHVHANAGTPLSADEATNLIITDGSGRQSNPFWIDIVPP